MGKSETKVKDLGFNKIIEELEKLDKGPFVKIGLPAEGKKTKEQREEGFTNLDIAFVQEFGSPKANIPERSHIRAAYDENLKKTQKFSDALVDKIYAGRITVEKALNLVGIKQVADIQKKIRSGIQPPVQRGGTPLLDTGQYVGSFSHKLIKSGKK